jgi:dTDP-glucose pyrophosphorylase
MGTSPVGVVPAGGPGTRMDSLTKVADKHFRAERIA